MNRKRKILLLSDHPLVPSGIGTQSKLLIEGLLKTGRYSFICGGGAMKHPDYTPQRVEPEIYGDDWRIIPVDGYGSKDFVRQMLIQERPDAIVIFTDPRFFIWVWEIEDEIRSMCPLLYWHVWDNDPTPQFNLPYYESTDHVVALSLKTYGLLQDIGYKRFSYIPHAIDPNVFKPLPESVAMEFKRNHLGPHKDRRFIVFWNNRNARRKQTGDVIACFAKFAERVGKDSVALMMHTDPRDQEGQDIHAVAKTYGIEHLIISDQRVESDVMNGFYNACDVTINIASAEGFGLGTLESLMAGTPIIVHMTGGLQFQIGDWWEGITDFTDQKSMTNIARRKWNKREGVWWGVPVFTASRSCTGSQQIPTIYDDRVLHEDVVKALIQVYEMKRSQRRELGALGAEWATRTFNLQKMIQNWDIIIGEQIEKHVPNRPRVIRI